MEKLEDNLHVLKQYNINKNESDAAAYKGLLLLNKMKVLLKSDLNLSMTYVALDINSGNYSNPKKFPGLAHLCQQTIILGTQKYPEYKQFERFIFNHGGDISLTTTSDHTTFFFQMNKTDDSIFKEAIDQFVQFFMTPLCYWFEKTIEMINANQKIELLNFLTWFQYFERSMVKSYHPYSNSTLCNSDILKKMSLKEIRNNVLNFLDKYYSANLMTLYVVSGYPLHLLENIIVEAFCQIRNKNVTFRLFYMDPFQDNFRTRWDIYTDFSDKYLKLLFPLPSWKRNCWFQAIKLISYLLESNDACTLRDQLECMQLSDHIHTHRHYEARGLSFFEVLIKLTPKAILHIMEIVALFFQYLNMFTQKYLTSEDGQSLLKEILSNMYECKLFEEKFGLKEEMITIVKNMHAYPMEDILFNKYSRKFGYTIRIIEDILNNYICPKTIRIYVIMNHDDSKPKLMEFKNTSKWDNIKYKKSKIGKALKKLLKEQLCSTLSLPYLHFQLKLPKIQKTTNAELFQIPTIIMDTPVLKLWYMFQEQFQSNSQVEQNSKMFFHFISPYVNKIPLYNILNIIFVKLIKDNIKEDEYFPKNVLDWKLKNTKYGILLEVISYTSMNYQRHLSKIISKILNLEICPNRFQSIKHHFMTKLKSFERLRPMEQAFYYLSSILSEKFFTYEEILKASAYITIEETKKFINMFIHKIYIECFVYGNMNEEQALNIARSLEFDMVILNNVQICTRNELEPHRVIKLDKDNPIIFETENRLSCLEIYYQIDKNIITEYAQLDFICYILSEKCILYFKEFKDMISRVCVKRHILGNMQGVLIAVEGFIEPNIIHYHIEVLIFYVRNYLLYLSSDNLEKYKKKLMTFNYSKETDLNQLADMYWNEIFTEVYNFRRVFIEKAYIKCINHKAMVTFYEDAIYKNKATVSVYVLPRREDKLINVSPKLKEFFSNQNDLIDLSDKSSEEFDIFEINANINTSSVTNTYNEPIIEYNSDDQSIERALLLKYFKKLQNWKYIKVYIPQEITQSFKIIDDILPFKYNRSYCKLLSTFRYCKKGEFQLKKQFISQKRNLTPKI